MAAGMQALGTSLGGFIARQRGTRFPRLVVSQGGASEVEQPPSAVAGVFLHTDGPRNEMVTSRDLVLALHQSAIGRVVMLAADAGAGALGSVELGRALTRAGLSCIVVDLSGDERIAAAMGVGPNGPGLSAFADGRATLADVIHRDGRSHCHVVPSTGGRTTPDSPDAALVLAACTEAYDCTLVALDRNELACLPALLDAETAIVVSGEATRTGSLGQIGDALQALGVDDLLYMQCAEVRTAAPIPAQ